MTWSRFTGNTECTYKRSRSEFHPRGRAHRNPGARVPTVAGTASAENHKPSSRTLLPTVARGQQESPVNPKPGVSLGPCWMQLSTSKGRDHRLTEVQLVQSRETFLALRSPLSAVRVEEPSSGTPSLSSWGPHPCAALAPPLPGESLPDGAKLLMETGALSVSAVLTR